MEAKPRVLVACEYSGIVREAFKAKGADAWSCDLLDTEIPGNHIKDDVLNHLNENWDLMIAHPPCQYLSYAAAHVWNKPGRDKKRFAAMNFFLELYNANIKFIAIENPVGYANTVFRKPDQIVKPYFFGQPIQKNICLWLKNLPLLKSTNIVKPKHYYLRKSGPKAGKKIHYAEALHGSKNRSKFFTNVAEAFADQWFPLISNKQHVTQKTINCFSQEGFKC
jgi:site-specific DNA-cytosine methylase